MPELNEYFRRAKDISKDELYDIAKKFFQKYVDQDKNIIVMLAADSIFTYFQDVFPATHYSECVGGNDVGKSSIGYTFAYTGYRVVRGTSISGANYTRILGSIEPGQCVIIEDEGDMISEDPVKVGILKAGYEYDMRVPKTNMNTKNQETNWFFPYCYKMVLAEKSLSSWKAKGLVDRTFTYQCRPGKVNYSIKKVVSQTINKSPELERQYNELLDFRKLMLCYRLIHYSDDLPQIRVNVRNRDEELSFPHLQLFYGTKSFEEIKTAMALFLKQRRRRRGRSLEAAMYPLLKEMIAKRTNFTADNPKLVNVLYSDIWERVTTGTAEERPIKGNLVNDYQYETRDHNVIYQNTFSKFIADKFSAEIRPSNKGSMLTFDIFDFENYDSLYNHGIAENDPDVVIEVTLDESYSYSAIDTEQSTSQSSEGSEGSRDAYDNFKDENNRENNNNNTNTPPEP